MELIDRAQDTIAKHQHEQTTAVPVKESIEVDEVQAAKDKEKENRLQVPPAAEASQLQQQPKQQTPKPSDLNSELFEDASIPESSFANVSSVTTTNALDTTTTTTAQSDSEANNDSFEHELGGYEDEGTDDDEREKIKKHLEQDPEDEDELDLDFDHSEQDETDDADADNEDGNDTETDVWTALDSQQGLKNRLQPTTTASNTSLASTKKDLVLPEATNLLEEVWLSIFTPGVNSKVVFVMDMCFYALFLCLFGLLVVSGGNFHVVFLLVIAACLFVTVKWFIAESKKVTAENIAAAATKQEEEKPAVDYPIAESVTPTETLPANQNASVPEESKTDQ
ncbi:UNVERIFIED_CONTAM: hypothetical protein HDU68_002659 [Siphonaria sp. JEL0065]|nr:hypothetical protein HDU68_002659 [Siphonaria sp. JEL0065]